MNLTESTLESAIVKAGLPVDALSGDGDLDLSAEEVDSILENAFQLGVRDGRRSVFKEEEDTPAQLFQQLMASLPDLVYFKDMQSRFICVNQAMASYFGASDPQEVVGKSDFDYFAPESAREKFEAEQQIIHTGRGWSFREEKDVRDDIEDRWVISSKLPLYNPDGRICGTFGLSRDITKQKIAEREVLRQRRLLETIIQILPCRLFLRDREGRYILVNEEYRSCVGIKPNYNVVGKLLTDLIDDPLADQVLAEDLKIIETGESITNQLEYEQSVHFGNRWVLSSKVPLRSESGEIEGIVGMSLDITEQKRAEDLARTAKEALQVKNEQYEEELHVARQLQEQLMSMGFDENNLYSKTCERWRFNACYLYNPSHHLAGDFFYLLPIDKKRIGILICDVMGHGVKAALVTMLIRGLMSEVPTILNHPSRVLQHLNETVISLAADEEFPRFVTAAYMTIDLESGEAVIANAGHPSPIINRHAESEALYEDCPMEVIGPALGLLPDEPFGDTTIHFSGDTEIYLFTDGIIEQVTGSGEDFGKVGLIAALQAAPSSHIQEQIDTIKLHLDKALGGRATTDDICLIALKISPTNT